MYSCPCCGYLVFDEPPGSYEICPICFWDYDIVQLAFPDMTGGANKYSLIGGQQNYKRFAACEERVKGSVRSPNESEIRDAQWRPLKTQLDRYLHWGNRDDRRALESLKDS